MAVAIVQKTRDYVTEVVDEMRKVTWPDWAQLKSATWVIILFVLIVAAIIFAMDTVVRAVIGLIMNVFAR
jgi:preprotein translocase subunit SecE